MPHELDAKALKVPGNAEEKAALEQAREKLKQKGRRADTRCVLVRGVIFNNSRPPA